MPDPTTAALRRVIPLLAALSVPGFAPPVAAAQDETEEIRARMEYDRIRLQSGAGVNLAQRLQLARRRVAAMIGTGPYPSSATSTRWRALGPERTDSYGRPTSGRVSAIAIHPQNPDIVYIGAAQGGVWRTDDAGASWRPLTDDQCSLAMGAIAIDPVNPQIVYAGTGEQHFSGDSYYGCGVLRSTDGGSSWERFGAGEFVRQDRGGARISRVFVDPLTAGTTNATVVMAASTFGLFRSEDSGRTWRAVLNETVTDLVMKPGDPTRLYAAANRRGVYRSMDGGVSWVLSRWPGEGFSRINLAVAPSAPDVLYASVFARSEAPPEREGLLMYRSDDGAATWRRLEAEGASCHFQCWYDMTLAVHPDDADRVHLGTLLLYLSEDGGQTFRDHHTPGTYVDQHLLVFDTLSGGDVLYLANDGGVYRSPDAGETFAPLSTNLAITQFYPGIALHPSDPAVALGGTQDQGTQSSQAGSAVWTKVLGGDGGFAAFDAENPGVWYGETQWASGRSYIGPRRNGTLAAAGIDRDEQALFLPPLVMDPVDSRRLYFGTTRLYRTDDAAETWTPIFESPGRERVVTAVAPSASDANTVYLAIGSWPWTGYSGSGGAVFATRDGGATWTMDRSGLPGGRFVSDLAVHPTDPARAYAAVGGFGTGHVFATEDGGGTWRDRSGNLPDMPANAVLLDPADPDGVYVGTDLGVFHSPTGGGMWSPLNDALPNAAVFDLAAQPGTGRLVAATHGRGMFEIPIDVPLAASARPAAVTEAAFAAVDTSFSGEVIVAPRGRGDYAAQWTARAGGRPWLSVAGGDGVGRGRFQYEIAAGPDLLPGDHAASITVSVAGAEPVEIPVTMRALHWSTIAASRTGARRSLPMGHDEPVMDSLGVELTGPRAALTEWSATRTGPGWARLDQASGTGDGTVTWAGDVSGLEVGLYVDTVLVASPLADESPATFLDSLSVEPPLAVMALQATGGLGMAGLAAAPGDSLFAGLTGFGADSAVWIAASGASWLVLAAASGGRSDRVVWSRSASGLEAGVHEDTISVGVRDHPGVRGVVVDRFDVQEPVGVAAAALQLLGVDGLREGQTDFLDWFGNGDGEFNVGDVLRWLDQCGASGAGDGCAPEPAPAVASDVDTGGEAVPAQKAGLVDVVGRERMAAGAQRRRP